MSTDAAKAVVTVGGALLSHGDPTLEDAQKAGAAHAYPLLFVVPGGADSRTLSITRSIQINAFDRQLSAEAVTAEDFLKESSKVFRKLRTAVQPTGPPIEVLLAGKHFWKLDLVTQLDSGILHSSQFALVDNGYFLLFTFSSLDTTELDELSRTMNFLHFTDSSQQ